MIILIAIILLVLTVLGLYLRISRGRWYYRGDITLEEDERRWERYYQRGGK